MKIRPIVAWYDLWVGVYIDRPGARIRRVFILPLPCVGIVLDFRVRRELQDAAGEGGPTPV